MENKDEREKEMRVDMKNKIKVRIGFFNPEFGKKAVVYREVEHQHKAINQEVLAQNGKWREKTGYEQLFEDEMFEIEEV